jgi:hypothetical protein
MFASVLSPWEKLSYTLTQVNPRHGPEAGRAKHIEGLLQTCERNGHSDSESGFPAEPLVCRIRKQVHCADYKMR